MIDVKQFSSDKILAHLDRIEEWLRSGISRPITFELDMTNVCNHRCPHCFGFFDRENREALDLAGARDIIRQIKELGGRGLTFTGGGEPLCNPATLPAVQYAREIGLDVGFITNGSLIDEQAARCLVKNCTWVRVSLDAASAEGFAATHGLNGRAFDSLLDSIRILVQQKKQYGSACTIGLGYLTSSRSAGEIYRFALLSKELQVDYAQYRPLLPVFGRQKLDYSNGAQARIIKEIHKSAELSGNGFQVLYSRHKYDCIQNGELTRAYAQCLGHHFATVICADKKMYVCCHFRGVDKYCIGDLNKNSLAEIWSSPERKTAYQRIDLKECIPLCRCNTFNTILWNITREKVHKNFI